MIFFSEAPVSFRVTSLLFTTISDFPSINKNRRTSLNWQQMWQRGKQTVGEREKKHFFNLKITTLVYFEVRVGLVIHSLYFFSFSLPLSLSLSLLLIMSSSLSLFFLILSSSLSLYFFLILSSSLSLCLSLSCLPFNYLSHIIPAAVAAVVVCPLLKFFTLEAKKLFKMGPCCCYRWQTNKIRRARAGVSRCGPARAKVRARQMQRQTETCADGQSQLKMCAEAAAEKEMRLRKKNVTRWRY